MTLAAFISAVLALLLAPGPTNTLMGLAGAQRGMGRVARLLPAELAGYMTTVLPLTWLGAGLVTHAPVAAMSLKLVAAAWVMVLAIRLWTAPGTEAETGRVTARRVYLTTVLNPKALVFGLVLLPPMQGSGFAGRLALFGLMVAGAALIWGTAGTLIRRGGAQRLGLVQRLASVWLAVIAVTLVAGAVTA